MFKTMLLVVDADGASHPANQLAIQWARQHDALLVVLGVVDERDVSPPESVPLGAGAYKAQHDAARLEEAEREVQTTLSQLAVACAELRVACKLLEGVGRIADEIAEQAQRYDLIVMPRATRLSERAARHGLTSSLWTLLHSPPRPIVTVPEQMRTGRGVLVAYDGSLPATRTLQAFQSVGLAADATTHVLALAHDRSEAAHVGDRAVDFLSHHEIAAELHAETWSGEPSSRIVALAAELGVELLVMGAYGHSRLRESLLGSTTRDVLAACTLPVFLFH